MVPRPGTVQTASSAKTSRSEKPSFRAKASKIRRTSTAFACSAATRSLGQAALPALEQRFQHPLLLRGEARELQQAARFGGGGGGGGGLEMLPRDRRLAQLAPQPA